MTTFDETEVTVEVPDGVPLPDLADVPGVATVDAPRTLLLRATYLDTDRLDLLRTGITLRRRSGGDDAGWHLKVPTGRDRQRVEHRRPVDDPQAPDELGQVVRGRVRDRPLGVVVEVVTDRTVRDLRDGSGRLLAEVADDRVRATVPGDGPESTWREWEVELVDGGTDLLDDVVATLARTEGATVRSTPKVHRALRDRVPRPADPHPRDRSAGEAVRAYLAAHVDRLVAADAGVRDGDDGAVHDARVATRRLRAALAAYRPVLDRTVTDPLRDALAGLGHALGEARDAAVERRALRRLLADEPVELVLGPVARRIEVDRSQGHAMVGVREHLESAAYFRLLDDLEAVAAHLPRGPRAHEDAADVLPRRVRRAWRRLRAAAEAAGKVTAGPGRDEALHTVRKEARRARYATEVARPLVRGRARRSARLARDVQDALGMQHDTVVRRETLRRLAVQAHLDGESSFTYGRLHAREQAAADQAEAAAAQALGAALDRRHRRWMR